MLKNTGRLLRPFAFGPARGGLHYVSAAPAVGVIDKSMVAISV